MAEHAAQGFFVAAFGIDGAPEGVAYWEPGSLSAKWIAVCDAYLEVQGNCFTARWSGPLSHIQTKLTIASGVGVAMFSVQGRLVASVALASGLSPTVETETLQMFVDSLRKVALVRHAAVSPDPFQNALAISERPLMVVVPWPDSAISEQDHSLVRELAIHTAGAFFARNLGST